MTSDLDSDFSHYEIGTGVYAPADWWTVTLWRGTCTEREQLSVFVIDTVIGPDGNAYAVAHSTASTSSRDGSTLRCCSKCIL